MKVTVVKPEPVEPVVKIEMTGTEARVLRTLLVHVIGSQGMHALREELDKTDLGTFAHPCTCVKLNRMPIEANIIDLSGVAEGK